MKIYVRFLFVVTCVICVSCSPLATDDADTLPSANPNTKQFQGGLTSTDKTQNDSMTIRKKIRVLLLKQDYQGALELMPQYEKELFEETLRDKESLENGKLKEETRYEVLFEIRSTYNYLYQVLGQDEVALKKFKEIELSKTTNIELLYMDCSEKLILLGRLNRVDEMINEMNSFFNNPNISEQSLSSLQHAVMMSTLINAHLVKGDIESAQKTINQMRDNLQRWPTHIIAVQQKHTMYSEKLALSEYYINNLTETHTVRFVRTEWKPPIPDPDDPEKIILDYPSLGIECVSKADGTPFIWADFRKIQADLTVPDLAQDGSMTIGEKQGMLLLGQDYQGALDRMPQFEKELFEVTLRDNEYLENGKLKEEALCAALLGIRYMYTYLYMVLGRDEEALQKIKEIELPKTAKPEWLYRDCMEKFIIFERLNMVDEAINEMKTFFNNPDISVQSISPLPHAIMMVELIGAHLVKGDIESAQKKIDQLRDNLQKWPIHSIIVQQNHTKFSEVLSSLEYDTNNLTESYTNRFLKTEGESSSPNINNPKKVNLDLSSIGNEQLVKVDNESAQKNINQVRDNLRKLPIHGNAVEQEYTNFSKKLLFLEYYVNNLTETHTMRFVRTEWKPPFLYSEDPKEVKFELQLLGFECVSKTDGTPFTIEDFRKIQAEQLRLQDPFLQPPPPPQHLEDPLSLP